MKNISLSVTFIICFVVSACKKDPPIPPFNFFNGIGILSMSQTGLYYGKDTISPFELKFVKVTEDSRCPEGMQCALAGIFSVEIMVDKSVSINIPNLNIPVNYNGYKIITTSATPYPSSGHGIKESEYKVEFKIYK